MHIRREEAFGPVAPIIVWSDEAELLTMANATEHSLAACVYAKDAGRTLRFAERLEAGVVAINRGIASGPSAPFDGVKQSGISREEARIGLEEFREPQYFSRNW